MITKLQHLTVKSDLENLSGSVITDYSLDYATFMMWQIKVANGNVSNPTITSMTHTDFAIKMAAPIPLDCRKPTFISFIFNAKRC